MAYTKQNWRRLKSELIPVEPENLEQIEDGIVELESRIQAGLGEIETTTTTTKADYSIEKPTEDFKVLEKVPFEEGVTYEAVVTVDEVEYSYSVQLVDGADLNLDYYDLTGFKVLTCGDLSGTTTRGLMIIQDCIASLSPLNATKTEGYTSIYSSYDKVVIKDVYVSTETTHKIKNQDAKYAEAFQADVLCTDEKDVSFIKNNPVQKELVKTKNKGYEIAFDATNFDVIYAEEDLIKIGYVKDTVLNSKIDFEAETLTATFSTIDSESETETYELIAVSSDEMSDFPKGSTMYFMLKGIPPNPATSRMTKDVIDLSGITAELAYILSKMLSLKTEMRYKNAQEIINDLFNMQCHCLRSNSNNNPVIEKINNNKQDTDEHINTNTDRSTKLTQELPIKAILAASLSFAAIIIIITIITIINL
jgi:hypothetical protein